MKTIEQNYEQRSLTVSKNNIFDKIMKFFSKLFSKNNENSYTEKKNDNQTFDRKQFAETVKISQSEEEKRILKLQKDLENGSILASEVSLEDYDKVMELYNVQISNIRKQTEELNKSTELYKEKIIQLQKELKEKK